MKKIIFLLTMIILGSVACHAQLNDEGEIGWVLNPDRKRISFHFITNKESFPEFISIQGSPRTDPCYLPINKVTAFRKFLKHLIKMAEKLEKSAVANDLENSEQEIPGNGPDVWMQWIKNKNTPGQIEYEGWDTLQGKWEYIKKNGKNGGSFLLISALVKSEKDDNETCQFKMWMSLETANFIVKKLLSSAEVDKWINYHVNRIEDKQRHMIDLYNSRFLPF